MAKKSTKASKSTKTTKKSVSKVTETKIKAEEAELARLKAENEALKAKVAAKTTTSVKQPKHRARSFFAGFFAVIAIVGFMLFNISYWVSYTITHTDKFVATMQPLLQDPAIQQALTTEISTALFAQVNVEQELKNNLPPNVQFLAAPLAGQIQSFTTSKIGEVLASPQAEKAWETILQVGHQKILAYIENPNNDGTISVDDLYVLAGNSLSNTSVGFIFNKDIPDKIGSIQVAQIDGVEQARSAINALKSLSLVLGLATLISAILALLLSQNRKKMAIGLAAFSLIMMLSTLAALSIGSSQVSGAVEAQYAAAAESVYRIITAPLVAKTQAIALIFTVALALTAIASNLKPFVWIRQNFRGALDWLMSHIVGSWKGNSVFTWIGLNHTVLLWVGVAASLVAFALRTPPTVNGITNAIISIAIVTLIVEALASVSRTTKR